MRVTSDWSFVPVHPDTLKHSKQGHPWIYADKFTEKFPQKTFLIATSPPARGKGNKAPIKKPEGAPEGAPKEHFLFLHDPGHPRIKGRFWSARPPCVDEVKIFPRTLQKRLIEALLRRVKLKIELSRECYYMVFGEADLIPGLRVLILKDLVLLQFYASFWKKLLPILLRELRYTLKMTFPTRQFSFAIEERPGQRSARKISFTDSYGRKNAINHKSLVIKEFGIHYLVDLAPQKDLGLYPDMSGIRGAMAPYFKGSQKLLNLYAHTGAFSLYALSLGVGSVTSVDLSSKHLARLEQNLLLNPNLPQENHRAMTGKVQDVLQKLSKNGEKFDFIICDPPSSSSDGNKRTEALGDYGQLIPLMDKCLTPGGHLLVFLNTMKVKKGRFRDQVEEALKKGSGDYSLVKTYGLTEDCPTLPGFEEGDYLKGLLFRKGVGAT